MKSNTCYLCLCFVFQIWYKDIPLEFTTEGRQTVVEKKQEVEEDKKSEDNIDQKIEESVSEEDIVWNAYMDKHSREPSNPQQLLNFSKNKENKVSVLGFGDARKLFEKNKGKGRIEIIVNKPATKKVVKEEEKKKSDGDGDKKKVKYLYFELLELVEIEAQNQLITLDKNINALADEHRNDWNKLIKWIVPTEYPKPRQDVIPNGIASQYTLDQLSESSGAVFNSPKFYDYNQYLSQLVLLAQIVCYMSILYSSS